MICFSSSAMNDILSKKILSGRPFGDIAILINDSYAKNVKLIKCCSRYMIVSMSDLLLVCIYLPCKSSNPNWCDQYLNTLYALEEDISTINYKDIIIPGDWIIDFNTNHPIKEILLSFLKSNDLCIG